MTSAVFTLLVIFCNMKLIFCASYTECHEDYNLVGTTCYKLYTTRTKWNTAEENCQQIPGYHLAKLENEEKHRELNTHLKNKGIDADEAWIGLGTEELNKWKWTDGSGLGDWAMDGQYPWKEGEPNGDRAINCARLVKIDNDYLWADSTCNHDKKYICSGPREDGFIKSESIALLYDSSEWEFLMNRATVQCQILKPMEDSFLVQTLFINRLPASRDNKVNVVLYFDRRVSCEEVNILKILTENCSGKNYYEKCIVSGKSPESGEQELCRYDCPVKIVEDKVTMSLITDPFYHPAYAKLCEMEIYYTS